MEEKEASEKPMEPKEWVKLYNTHKIHPNKAVMVDMIGDTIGQSVSGIYSCGSDTIKRLWVAICCKKPKTRVSKGMSKALIEEAVTEFWKQAGHGPMRSTQNHGIINDGIEFTVKWMLEWK